MRPSPHALQRFHQALGAWYARHGRKYLPWRNTRDAYRIYLSEIMLQQTQVKTVLERFYHPFLTRFPTLKSVASAKEEDVLRAWQGLGYYSRALNFHKAARQCNCVLPRTVEELVALPGIGRNTAHAIAAFAYHAPVPVMEANLRRVLSRVFALEHATDTQLWECAHWLLDTKHPFDYNQAMMDVGALVCRKSSPACAQCPAALLCKGKSAPESYPAAKPKKQIPVRKKRIAVLVNERGQYYATPRTTRFLGGLYHFVELPADTTHIAIGKKEYALCEQIGHVQQLYSHFTLEAEIYRVQVSGSGKHWHGHNALRALPLSAAEQKILALLARGEAANG
jgi:A/G-specific adenine glycosylase